MKVNTATATTIAGGTFATAEFFAIDWAKLLHGDATEIGHVVKFIAASCWAWYTNRKGTINNTVAVGTPVSPEAPVLEGTKKET